MSESITIKEGGASRAFGPVSRLRVLKQGTGTEDFVPESGTTLKTKSITENGIYPATQDNAYGYSQVSVNCSQEADSLTGKKQDENEYTVSRDEDGNIEEDKVPSALLIALAPLKNAYNDGETIDLTGIVAVAVDGNDQPWTGGGRYPDGIIPASELVLPVNTAHYDETAPAEYYATSDLDVSVPCSVSGYVYGVRSGDIQENVYISCSNCLMTIVLYPGRNGTAYTIIVAKKPNESGSAQYTVEIIDYSTGNTSRSTSGINPSAYYIHDNEQVQYQYVSFPFENAGSAAPSSHLSSYEAKEIAWTMIYGTRIALATQQDVVVQWRRPGDGKTLSDSFAILVTRT